MPLTGLITSFHTHLKVPIFTLSTILLILTLTLASFFKKLDTLAKILFPWIGNFYLVDSGYPNRPGYLAPYRGQKYHFQEFQQGTIP
jgi:hypothetical protein